MICRDGGISNLKAEGVPLGLLPDREYEEISFVARAGDLIVLFSDGVSDHMSESGEDYGSGRLGRILQQHSKLTPPELVKRIFADLDEFNTIRFDDQTLIIMRVKQ